MRGHVWTLVVGVFTAASAVATAQPAPTPPLPTPCPTVRLPKRGLPTLASRRTLKELERAIVKIKQPENATPLDLAALAAAADAFAVKVHAGVFKDSTNTFDHHHAVFVHAKRFLHTSVLLRTNETKAGSCGPEVQGDVLAVRMLTVGKRTLGHVRLRRREVTTPPTLPAVTGTRGYGEPECHVLDTFRIEDHVFDLASGKHLAALGQTYQGPLYEQVDAGALPIEKLAITDKGIRVDDARCPLYPFR